MRYLQDFLAIMGLEGRLHLEWISSAEAQKFVQVVTDFTEKVKKLGPSPLALFTENTKAQAPKPLKDSTANLIMEWQSPFVESEQHAGSV